MDTKMNPTNLALVSVAIWWALLTPIICACQSVQDIFSGRVLCRERVAITAMPSGVSSISLGSGTVNWRVMPDELADVEPAVAEGTVAIITHSFDTIYAFSFVTGNLIWQRENRSNILQSDGRYFYVLAEDETAIAALDPSSGRTVWSLHLPRTLGGPLYFARVHQGFLYADRFVIDLSRRAIVHIWPEEPQMNTVAFGGHGEVLTGDSSGVVTAYSARFKRLRRVYVAKGQVVEAAMVGRYVLAAVYQYNFSSYRGRLVLVTPDGKRKWQLVWSSDTWLDQEPFVIAGREMFVIEPGIAPSTFRMVSRKLSSGRMNWASPNGFFFGPAAVCGETVYASDGHRVRGFDLRSGVERTAQVDR